MEKPPTNLLVLSAPSTKPENLQLAKTLLRETQKRYPNQELNRDTAQAFIADWARMIQEFGATEFQARLLGAMSHCTFFPHEADIRDASPVYATARPAKKLCSRCQDSEGWLYVTVSGEINPRVMRCPHSEGSRFTVRVGPTGDNRRVEAQACDSVQEPAISAAEVKRYRGIIDKLVKGEPSQFSRGKGM